MKRVAIIHPWLPNYRVAFFEGLVEAGLEIGIEIKVFCGEPDPLLKFRGDAGVSDKVRILPTRHLKIFGKYIQRKRLTAYKGEGYFDLVVLEQAIKNIETYELLLSKTKVAFWGHGKTFTQRESQVNKWLKSRLTNMGSWFFAYTSAGAESVIGRGFPRNRITVLNNSVDASTLRDNLLAVSELQFQEHASRVSADKGSTALYLGALDAPKRITFLLEAATIVAGKLPNFHLHIVGDGELKPSVLQAAELFSWISYGGVKTGFDLATALKSSSILMIPGRVGLVAVDSLISGVPIATTDWDFHAPEFEYLHHGVTCLVTRNSVEEYAQGVVNMLTNKRNLEVMKQKCLTEGGKYGTEAMIHLMLEGIQSCLGQKSDDVVQSKNPE
jgi:glycosyltransferase involved in cell wall biosynthesis